MTNWIAYLYYSNGKIHEFHVFARSYEDAKLRIETIFPNIHFVLKEK